MMYRIKQKFYIDGKTCESNSYYVIEHFSTDLMKSLLNLKRKCAWEPYKSLVCYGVYWHREFVRFGSVEEAEKYLKDLKKSESSGITINI